jgi:hypothetical protein
MALLAAALIAAGCSSGSSPSSGTGSTSSAKSSTKAAAKKEPSPTQVVGAAYAKTIAKGGARMALTVTGADAGTGSGVIDFAHRATRLTMNSGGDTVEIRQLGLITYLRVAGQPLPDGKTWMRVDAAALAKSAGLSSSDLQSLTGAAGQSDPSSVLSYLQGVSSGAQKVGSDTIRGVKATHYRVTVDLLKVASRQPPAARKAMTRALTAAHLRTESTDVWTDDQGLVRRFRGPQPAAGAAKATPATVQLDLYDYGTTARVVAPPAAQTEDLAVMLQQLKALSGSGN